MDTNLLIFLSAILVTNIISLYTGKIQKTRIEGLEATLKQQTESVNIIKAFAELKDVDEHKKYTDLKMEVVRMEREKEVSELKRSVRELIEKLNENYKEIYDNRLIKIETSLEKQTQVVTIMEALEKEFKNMKSTVFESLVKEKISNEFKTKNKADRDTDKPEG